MKNLKDKLVKLKANKPLFITLIVVGVLVLVGVSCDIKKVLDNKGKAECRRHPRSYPRPVRTFKNRLSTLCF